MTTQTDPQLETGLSETTLNLVALGAAIGANAERAFRAHQSSPIVPWTQFSERGPERPLFQGGHCRPQPIWTARMTRADSRPRHYKVSRQIVRPCNSSGRRITR